MTEVNPENESLEWGASRLVFDRRPEQEREEQAASSGYPEVSAPRPYPGHNHPGNRSDPYTFPGPTPPAPEWVKNIVARRRLAQEDTEKG